MEELTAVAPRVANRVRENEHAAAAVAFIVAHSQNAIEILKKPGKLAILSQPSKIEYAQALAEVQNALLAVGTGAAAAAAVSLAFVGLGFGAAGPVAGKICSSPFNAEDSTAG